MKEGWEYTKLGEVCEIKAGFTPKANELSSDGSIPYFKVADMNTIGNEVFLGKTKSYLSNSRKYFEKDAIVFPKNGAAVSTNKKRILKYNSIVDLNTAVAIFSNVYSKFAYYWFLQTDFRDYVRGGALPTLDIKYLKERRFPLPPLFEQQSIVAELDKINEIIDLKKDQLKDLDLLAQSIFYDMFGDPVDNPKGWEVKKLGNVCDNITKGTTPTTIGFNFTESGISFVKVESFNADSSIDVSKLAHISLECYNAMVRSQLKAKDIMICIAGATVGKIAIVDDSILPANTNQACAIVRLAKDSTIEHKYVLNYLKQYIKLVVHNLKKGAAQPNLSLGQIRDTKICIPPISLQQSFASKIQAIESQKSAIKQSLTEMETLLASRMDYYFN